MATTKEYKDFVLEQLNLLDDISCKKMMANIYCIIEKYCSVEYTTIDFSLKLLKAIKNTICQKKLLMKKQN